MAGAWFQQFRRRLPTSSSRYHGNSLGYSWQCLSQSYAVQLKLIDVLALFAATGTQIGQGKAQLAEEYNNYHGWSSIPNSSRNFEITGEVESAHFDARATFL